MKSIIIYTLLISSTLFASVIKVPSNFLYEKTSKQTKEESFFSRRIDGILNSQEEALGHYRSKNSKLKLDQLITSFTISKSGLFGLSALGANSNTSLFWKRRGSSSQVKEVETFTIKEGLDDIELENQAIEITDYLISKKLLRKKERFKKKLMKAIKKGNTLFNSMEHLAFNQWEVAGLRLDLSFSANGNLAPFTGIGGSSRLWIEWKKNTLQTKKTLSLHKKDKKLNNFIEQLLKEVSLVEHEKNLGKFKLTTFYAGIGQNLRTGFFGIGNSHYGFVGYIKLKRNPYAVLQNTTIEKESLSLIQDEVKEKNIGNSVMKLPRKKFQKGIQRAMKYVSNFSQRQTDSEKSKWYVHKIRQITTLSKSGFLGISNLSSRAVFIMIFEREPQNYIPHLVEASYDEEEPTWEINLIRLNFIASLGFNVPWVAGFTLRPNVELIWN